MKLYRTVIFICLLVFGAVTSSFAIRGVPATSEDIARLKRDLLEGKIKIGTTRLSYIQDEYGEPPNIIDDNQRITYDYNDLRLTFERERIWRSWDYDTFKDPVYTDAVDDLRFDLESKQLVGDNITFNMIRRSYGEPTESHVTDEDGKLSVYYYGDIEMVFENVIAVTSWRGTNLGEIYRNESFNTRPLEETTEEVTEEAP